MATYKGLTLAEISRRTGLSRSHITRIFNGERLPSIGSLQAIAKVTNARIDDVVKWLPPRRVPLGNGGDAGRKAGTVAPRAHTRSKTKGR